MKNPKEGLAALVDPAPITLGQIALLDLYGSPLLKGEIGDLNACIFSLWILSMPLDLAVQEAHFPDKAIVWAETLDTETYNRRLTAALDGIAAFFHILPRPENGDGLKKKRAGASATATSPSSRKRSAASTAGRSATCSRRSRRSRRGSSTASTRREREV